MCVWCHGQMTVCTQTVVIQVGDRAGYQSPFSLPLCLISWDRHLWSLELGWWLASSINLSTAPTALGYKGMHSHVWTFMWGMEPKLRFSCLNSKHF